MSKVEKVFSLAKRRGFFWPAYEIYGGVAGFYTWGPYGVLLKKKIMDLWREMFVYSHGFYEIDSPTIAPYIVFKASGHVEGFKDVMVTCLKCGKKFRVDNLLQERGIEAPEGLKPEEYMDLVQRNGVRCPSCGGELGEPGYFITMFKTTIGPYSDATGFLRPETAQGMFVEFKRIYEIFRKRFPVGIAQIGRGYRNEISPRQGVIRLREFDMMEIEYFFDPEKDDEFNLDEYMDETLNILHEELIREGGGEYETLTVREILEKGIVEHKSMLYFMILAQRFLEALGIPRNRQRFREKLEGERAHYARKVFDQEVLLDRWGWVEVSGHADRTNYDLSRHREFSGEEIYVERRLPQPKEIESRYARPKPRRIKEDYPDQIGSIMKELSSIDPVEIYNRLSRDGYIEVGGVRLGKEYFDLSVEKKVVQVEKFIPHVVEPSFGLDRISYAVLEYAYVERGDRIILSLPPYIAPIEAAVYPLLDRDDLKAIAESIVRDLESAGFRVFYDYGDSIGRLYARGDEIGIPVAFTVDIRSLKDDTVTVRDRDTWIQYRIKIESVVDFVERLIQGMPFQEVASSLALERVEA